MKSELVVTSMHLTLLISSPTPQPHLLHQRRRDRHTINQRYIIACIPENGLHNNIPPRPGLLCYVLYIQYTLVLVHVLLDGLPLHVHVFTTIEVSLFPSTCIPVLGAKSPSTFPLHISLPRRLTLCYSPSWIASNLNGSLTIMNMTRYWSMCSAKS